MRCRKMYRLTVDWNFRQLIVAKIQYLKSSESVDKENKVSNVNSKVQNECVFALIER